MSILSDIRNSFSYFSTEKEIKNYPKAKEDVSRF